jgi:carbon storage regulator
MLVVTRKIGEKINIGEDIVVSIVDIGRGSVRIGIDAPKKVSILRHEVFLRIQEENLQSARGETRGIEDVARLIKKKKAKE